MHVLGKDSSSVIVKLEYREWIALGGKTVRDSSGYMVCETSIVPNICQLVEALKAIKNASPDLVRIRASFQTFLMLTEPAAVGDVLENAGVAEEVELEGDSDE